MELTLVDSESAEAKLVTCMVIKLPSHHIHDYRFLKRLLVNQLSFHITTI